MAGIKVMIIEDSALTRSVLERIINAADDMEVVGTAFDPIFAAKKIQTLRPDVITLDLVMPRMDGLTFLKKLMKTSPLPVVVISANSPKASTNAISALELGAVDIIEKPDISTPERLREVSESITLAIRAAYSSLKRPESQSDKVRPAGTAQNAAIAKSRTPESNVKKASFIVIGASTGGPETLRHLLGNIGSDCPGIVIAQHMPPVFTTSFAARLNSELPLRVVEASDGDRMEHGKVMIIPGDYHGQITRDNNGYVLRLSQTEKVNRHRPSIDILFNSAAKVAAGGSLGILLTGMGDDGARGLLSMSDAGCDTIAQDAESCIVYGMPRKAQEIGAARLIMNPARIADYIVQINTQHHG